MAGEYSPWLLLGWPLFVTLGKLSGIYGSDEKRAQHGIVDDTAGIFQCLTASSFLVLVISLLVNRPVDTIALVSFWSLTLAFVIPARVAAYAVIRRTPTYVQRTIIVGAGDVGQLIARKIMHHPEYGINLIGFVDDPRPRRPSRPRAPRLGRDSRASRESHDVERVIIAFSLESNEHTLSIVRRCDRRTSRSTSSRDRSSSLGRASTSTRSKASRSWACRPSDSLGRPASSSVRSTLHSRLRG